MDALPSLPENFIWLSGSRGLGLAHDTLGVLRPDFVTGDFGYRIRFGGGKGNAVFRAVGEGKDRPNFVLDATGGLGRDAFLLAWLGCRVISCERSESVYVLVADALERAEKLPEIKKALDGRLKWVFANASEVMRSWKGALPDVVYLDPMYPDRHKSALVKKEMRIFRHLVGADFDSCDLLRDARQFASRVVVKRPRKEPPLAEGVSSSWEGKTTRFDLYLS